MPIVTVRRPKTSPVEHSFAVFVALGYGFKYNFHWMLHLVIYAHNTPELSGVIDDQDR